jgi:hypothetical protein
VGARLWSHRANCSSPREGHFVPFCLISRFLFCPLPSYRNAKFSACGPRIADPRCDAAMQQHSAAWTYLCPYLVVHPPTQYILCSPPVENRSITTHVSSTPQPYLVPVRSADRPARSRAPRLAGAPGEPVPLRQEPGTQARGPDQGPGPAAPALDPALHQHQRLFFFGPPSRACPVQAQKGGCPSETSKLPDLTRAPETR